MITINVDLAGKEPIYEQIYKYIKNEIETGTMECGAKLPSCRRLASDLSVSRNTIDMAYGQLVAEGYIDAVPQKGYYVSNLETLYAEGIHVDLAGEETESENHAAEDENFIDFSLNGVDMNYFPYDKWRKLMKDCLIDDNRELFHAGNHQGDYELRKALANYIHQSRGVKCKASQIIIGAGSDYMMLLLSHILGNDQYVAIENPAYWQAYTIFTSVDYKVIPIDVDEMGLNVTKLKNSDANIAYVTPSHQFPLGMVMPAKRRQELLSWAFQRSTNYIIEDDYDSEFRYYGRPIPSLQSQDPFGKVIYMGTLSKVIAPGIRLSYMVLPEKLMKQYQDKCGFYFSTVSRIDQRVIGQFFVQGYFERHLNKMRKIYKGKHDLLVKGLKDAAIPVKIITENAGLHIQLQFGDVTDCAFELEEKLVSQARAKGIILYPLSRYCIQEKMRVPTILIGYARLSEEDIRKGIEIIKSLQFTF